MAEQEQQQQPQQENMAATANTPLNTNVPLPPQLCTTGDIAANFKKWRQIWDSFEIVTGLKNKSSEYRTATLLTCIGADGIDIFNGLPFQNDDEKKDIAKVIEHFERHCIGELNVIYERYVFNNRVQESGETFDNFVSALRTLAKTCR